jgi:chromosome partitioning protein
MSKKIAVCNQKGGVRKTTVTHNFSAKLAQDGYRVLMVDYDSQANLTLACGIEAFDDLEVTLADTLASVIRSVTDGNTEVLPLPIFNYRENLDLVPANTGLAGVNIELHRAMSREWILDMALAAVKDDYDYILIDCAPSLGFDLINALVTADEALIVTNPAKFSSKGSHQLMNSVSRIMRNLNSDLVIAGVIFNRVARTNLAKDFISVMKESWQEPVKMNDMEIQVDPFKTEIPVSVKMEECQTMGVPLLEYDANGKVTTAYRALVGEYLKTESLMKQEREKQALSLEALADIVNDVLADGLEPEEIFSQETAQTLSAYEQRDKLPADQVRKAILKALGTTPATVNDLLWI